MLRLTDSGSLVMEIAVQGDIIVHTITAAELKAALAEAGLAIVPVEPTRAMRRALAINFATSDGDTQGLERYRAMLQAALKEAE